MAVGWKLPRYVLEILGGAFHCDVDCIFMVKPGPGRAMSSCAGGY